MKEITDDFYILQEQATYTAVNYLNSAVEAIDKKFGAGFSKNNPELVGSFIKACALDYETSVIACCLQQSIGKPLDEIGTQIFNISESIHKL